MLAIAMAELVTVLLAFPTVVPTVFLGVIFFYWLLVIFGALDIDVGRIDGAADGMLDGTTERAVGWLDGAIDGAADGVLDGSMDGAAEGGSHALVSVDHMDGLASAEAAAQAAQASVSLLSLAHFRSVPITVMVSVLTFFAWLLCIAAVRLFPFGTGALGWLIASVVLILSFALALLPTAVALRPLAPLFKVHAAKTHLEMVGKVCVITTGSVDQKFGQARLTTDDLDLIVQVRQDKAGTLKKGDRALVLAWDAKREAFLVEPYDKLLTSPSQ